jgi:hypothetical protein
MIENERQFESFVRQLKFDDTPDYRHRDKLEQKLLAALAQSPQRKQSRLNIWRLIVQSRTSKRLVAAVLFLAVLIGIALLDTDRVVFGKMVVLGKITGTAKTGLAHLKELVSEMRKGISEPRDGKSAGKPLPGIPTDQNEVSKTVEAGKTDAELRNKLMVSASVQICTVKAKSKKSLQRFFETQTIQFTQVKVDPNSSCERPAFWAKLDPNKTEAFLRFAKSLPELHILASPQLVLVDGTEGIIYTGSSVEGLAVALVPTVLDDDGRIGLTFGFLLDAGKDRQSGFEISNIETGTGETLLVRTTTPSPEPRSLMARIFRSREETPLLILLRLKVMPPEQLPSEKKQPDAKPTTKETSVPKKLL